MKEKPKEPFGLMPSPHRLHDTFATAGHEAQIAPLDLKLLMNHILPKGNVTEGYIRPSVEHLRDTVELVGVFLAERLWPNEHGLRTVPRS